MRETAQQAAMRTVARTGGAGGQVAAVSASKVVYVKSPTVVTANSSMPSVAGAVPSDASGAYSTTSDRVITIVMPQVPAIR